MEIHLFTNKEFPVMATVTEKQLKNSKAGGALAGKRNGQTIIYKDGSLGGYAVGRMHKTGGIKGTVKGGGQQVEFQGNEVVITAPAVADNTKHEFNGQMLTNRQILSKINEAGGGVSFAKGGPMPKTVKCFGKKYTYGGKLVTDHDIVGSCGCTHEKAQSKAKGGEIENEYLTVYHGTMDKGYGSYKYRYFTADKEYAAQYAESTGRIIVANVTIKKPFKIEAKYMGQGAIILNNKIIGFYRNLQPDAVEKLKKAGYDGIVVDYPEKNKNNFEVIPFDIEQVEELKAKGGKIKKTSKKKPAPKPKKEDPHKHMLNKGGGINPDPTIYKKNILAERAIQAIASEK